MSVRKLYGVEWRRFGCGPETHLFPTAKMARQVARKMVEPITPVKFARFLGPRLVPANLVTGVRLVLSQGKDQHVFHCFVLTARG